MCLPQHFNVYINCVMHAFMSEKMNWVTKVFVSSLIFRKKLVGGYEKRELQSLQFQN